MLRILGAFLFCLVSVSPSFAMGTPIPTPNSLWHPNYFNGKEFRSGSDGDTVTVYLRDGYLPFMLKDGDTVKETRLPETNGAVAGIVYYLASGGKLRSLSGSFPLPEFTVEITGSTGRQTAKTDSNGFFVIAAPPGEYEMRVAGTTRKITLEPGKTGLLAIRAAIRMGD